MSKNPDYSLILPVFNEQEVLPLLYRRLCEIDQTLGLKAEWLFIDDGSKDATLTLLLELAAMDPRVKVISFSKNFGHQTAVTAGVDLASGDLVIIMDADLQDPPELVGKMIMKHKEGFDVVYARRVSRQGETFFKLATARAFYWFMARFVYPGLPENVGDFRLMSRRATDAMRFIPEHNRFYRGLVTWAGFKQTAIPFERAERALGVTKYPLRKMIKFALDAMLSFSWAPLRAAYWFGVVGLVAAAWAAWKPGSEWVPASALVLQSAGLFCVAFVGEYLARVHEESKRRPLYIVALLQNLDAEAGQMPSGGIIVAPQARKPASRLRQAA